MVARFSRRRGAFPGADRRVPGSGPGLAFVGKYPGKTLEVAPLRDRRRPWGHVVALEPGGADRSGPEKPPGLGGREARKLRRLEECRAAIGGLDQLDDVGRQLRRPAGAPGGWGAPGVPPRLVRC